MRKQELQLVALWTAPLLVVVMLCLAILYRRPDLPNLLITLSATLATLALSVAGYRWYSTHIVDALARLARDIPSFTPEEGFRRYPEILRAAIHAIERSLGDMQLHQRQEIESLSAHIAALETSNAASEAELKQGNYRRAAERRRTAGLASACMQAMASIVGFVNLMRSSGKPDPDYLTGISVHVDSLKLLVSELGNVKPVAVPAAGTLDIRELTDETLAALACTGRSLVFPMVDIRDPMTYTGDLATIRSILFNYLLLNVDEGTRRPVPLQVRKVGAGEVAFSLGIVDVRSDERLDALMHAAGARIKDNILHVSLDPAEKQARRFSLGALVFADTSEEERALEARLESMGLHIVHNSYRADVALVCIADAKETGAILDKLAQETLVLAVKNASPIPRPGVRQLRFPIHHEELVQVFSSMEQHRQGDRRLALVVDDSPSNLRLTALLLDDLGFTVQTAHDGTEAISRAREDRFDLVIMDLHMPGLDGLETAAVLKEYVEPDTPVLLLTARITDEERARTKNAFVTDILIKPLRRETLMQFVEKLQHESGGAAPIFDNALALRLANGRPDIAEELLGVLIEGLPDDREDINLAWTVGDRARFNSLVHRVYGGLKYAGTPRLRHAVSRLDAISRSTSVEDIRLALEVFNGEVDALLAWYDPDENYFGTSILPRTSR
ncbi:MAG: response regulator [Pseudomonadales bacterium]|nr:response regulator [Pseudomonadales bacterium]